MKNAKFINNDLNWVTYRDGFCDEAEFVKDGIHLSTHGLSKLLSNIALSEWQQTQLQDRGKTDRPIVKGRRRKERRATLAVTGRTLTGLLQARHVGQRAATTLQNRHGTSLVCHDTAATCNVLSVTDYQQLGRLPMQPGT